MNYLTLQCFCIPCVRDGRSWVLVRGENIRILASSRTKVRAICDGYQVEFDAEYLGKFARGEK